jgi:hypothetical protein
VVSGASAGRRGHRHPECRPHVRGYRATARPCPPRRAACVPFSRFAASQPRGPPLSVVFTLSVSMIAGFPPSALAQHDHEVVAKMLSHTPSRREAHIWPYTVRQGGKAKGGGRCRHWQPVRTRWNRPSSSFRMSVVRGRPPGLPDGMSGSNGRNWPSVSAWPEPKSPTSARSADIRMVVCKRETACNAAR